MAMDRLGLTKLPGVVGRKGFAPRKKGTRVGILGFDGLAIWDLASPLETLAAARVEGEGGKVLPCYEPKIIAVDSKKFISESKVAFTAKETLSRGPDFDTLIIPGGSGITDVETRRRVADWLATHAQELQRIVAISGGIYPLAESGLLDGRTVATHWRFAQDLSRRFPRVRVDLTASFAKDGPFYTCGGGTSPAELTLALIEEDYGARVALSVARELCVRLRPVGDRTNAVDFSLYDCGPADRLAELPSWISSHLNENLSVETLAARACLCPRHFSRIFKLTFGATPASFVETLRIEEAQRRLLSGRGSIEGVAGAVGFKDPNSFRRAFTRRLGVNPATFRRQRFSLVVDHGRRSTQNRQRISSIAQRSVG